MYALTLLLVIGGLVGGRLFYVLEHGGSLVGTRGFTFDGGFIAAGLLLAFYVRRAGGLTSSTSTRWPLRFRSAWPWAASMT